MGSINDLLKIKLIAIDNYEIKVYTLVVILIIILVAKLFLWLFKAALFRRHKRFKYDTGNAYSFYQLTRYVIWVIAISIILETIGIKITMLIAGSAALLVGVGLGLQQTFNDIVSGIILLFERSIKIDDILEIDGNVVKIQEIGLRTSVGIDRDGISVIIPNSMIITNKVINWSHQTKKTRFKINVGTSYGSDVDLVLKVLMDSALEHPEISDKKLVESRLISFNNSSIDFQLLFYSVNIFRIERIKSDIRKIIARNFIKNNITIPFPQMDIHMKNEISKKEQT